MTVFEFFIIWYVIGLLTSMHQLYEIWHVNNITVTTIVYTFLVSVFGPILLLEYINTVLPILHKIMDYPIIKRRKQEK